MKNGNSDERASKITSDISKISGSVESERLFSLAGLLCCDRRNRMLPLNLERLLFLKFNSEIEEQAAKTKAKKCRLPWCSVVADESYEEMGASNDNNNDL